MHLLKKLSLIIAPIVASSMIAALPSKAATLASSQGLFDFTEFSQSPVGSFTGNVFDVTTRNGPVFAEVLGNSTFLIDPPAAGNFSSAIAIGDLSNYLGIAEIESTVVGRFEIAANTTFSFNFEGSLLLETLIDDSTREQARAAGEIVFTLLDIDNGNTILDAFLLTGNLETPGNNDFIVYGTTNNIVLNNPTTIEVFGDNQELAAADVNGYYQRTFAEATNLALVEIKLNRAEVVAVPEPGTSNIFVLLIGFGVFGFAIKTKPKLST